MTRPTDRSVLFLAGEYPPRPGGVGDYTALLASALAAQGVRVAVLATRDLTPATPGEARSIPPRPFAGRGGPADGRRATVGEPTGNRQAGSLPPPFPRREGGRGGVGPTVWRAVERWDWRCGAVVRAAARAARADIVHVQYQPAAFGLEGAVCWLPRWLERREPGVRTVATFHDLRVPYLWPKAGPLRAAARDRLLRGVDAAVFTEQADWAAARRVRPMDRHWIPIGANLQPTPPDDYDRQAWRARLGADHDTLLIAHLGFLNRSKGLETLLAALRRLWALGRAARLVLIGAEAGETDAANRAYAAEVAALLAAPDLAAGVVRLPVLPPSEVSACLLAADVAAFPFADGASLRRGSLLAALAHGLPTVSTWPPGRPSGTGAAAPPGAVALRDGDNVLLVPVGDAVALAAALLRLDRDAALRARLAAGGPALVAALAWPRIAAAHQALYARLLAR